MLKTIYLRVGKKVRKAEAEINGKTAYVTVFSGDLPVRLEFRKWYDTEADAHKSIKRKV